MLEESHLKFPAFQTTLNIERNETKAGTIRCISFVMTSGSTILDKIVEKTLLLD